MTLSERIRAIIEPLPDGSAVTLPTDVLRAWIAEDGAPAAPVAVELTSAGEPTWRERIWTVPGETRLGVREVAEALDRSPDWVYRATNARQAEGKGRAPLPCSRLDGALVFTAAAVREWVQRSERTINPAPRPLRAVNGV